MHDAIYAQPGALRLVARGQADAIEAAALRLRGLDHVLLTGVGTSWHAALVGELLFARLGELGLKARAFHAFELASYWPEAAGRAGVVVLSHGGTRRYSREALKRVKAGGGTGVVITGKGPEAPEEADWTLRTVDQESSGAHTVSYTAALALLAKLACAAGGKAEIARSIDGIPDMLAFLLGQESWEDMAARYGEKRCYWFVGGGPNTATAWEAALKMSEASHAPAVGFNCEQFLHGAWAALEPDDVVFLIAPPGPSHERCCGRRTRGQRSRSAGGRTGARGRPRDRATRGRDDRAARSRRAASRRSSRSCRCSSSSTTLPSTAASTPTSPAATTRRTAARARLSHSSSQPWPALDRQSQRW
jgi:glucosamine--fructose-6-phosphate aminotransferase (isomerizing)